jgi:nitrile hydratase beta subunit
MDKVHDMGGRMGFGAINPESDEPPFHHEWERRAFALTLAMGATRQWNIDMSRHARETLPPKQYLSSSYYEIWFAGLIKLLARRGLVEEEELEIGKSLITPAPISPLAVKDVPQMLSKGSSYARPSFRTPHFKPGDYIRATRFASPGHTRLPSYVRGRRGEIVRLYGSFVFPDTNAEGKGENPQFLYNVKFSATELWHSAASGSVHMDLWESYLESE